MNAGRADILDAATHPQAIRARAVNALLAGDPVTAFRLADRRCRINPAPEPEDFLLRAEAAGQLGRRAAALVDIRTALAIDPDHVLANRKLLAHGNAGERARAARSLLRVSSAERDIEAGLAAYRVRGKGGVLSAAWSCGRLRGWAAWRGDASIELRALWSGGTVEWTLKPDPLDPLARILGCATRFDLPWPASVGLLDLTTTFGIDLLTREIRSPIASRFTQNPLPRARGDGPGDDLTTIIVPVYRDVPATQACLESLVGRAGTTAAYEILVVDDASPEPEMRPLLDRFAAAGAIRLLTNSRNLGFVRAVNRALDEVKRGDVVLLNADTVAPPGFLDRLIAASRLEPNVGTVTPLSNNGEFTSLPKPFVENPLPTQAEIDRLDQLAAQVSAGTLHDIPSGIGFCMLITRPCLDALGGLDSGIERGYLEDVDFCLRARAAGFRNVCAPFVYVGHAGSRSFGVEKRALVMRNMRALDLRYPHYRLQVGEFLRSDPLRAPRARLERACMAGLRFDHLVFGDPALGWLDWRGRAVREGARVLVGAVTTTCGHTSLALRSMTSDMPQSLTFDLSKPEGTAAAASLLRQVGVMQAELVEPSPVPTGFVQALHEAGIACNLYIAGAEPSDLSASPADRSQNSPGASGAEPGLSRPEPRENHERTRALARLVRRVLVPNEEAHAYERSALETQHLEFALPEIVAELPEATAPRVRTSPGRLGLLLLSPGPTNPMFALALARACRRHEPEQDLVVLGATLDDGALYARGDVFVTGPFEPGELGTLCRAHGISSLFVAERRMIFAHPLLDAAKNNGIRLARIGFVARSVARQHSLQLPPWTEIEDIAQQIVRWHDDGSR